MSYGNPTQQVRAEKAEAALRDRDKELEEALRERNDYRIALRDVGLQIRHCSVRSGAAQSGLRIIDHALGPKWQHGRDVS